MLANIALGALLVLVTTVVHALCSVGLMKTLRSAHVDEWDLRRLGTQTSLVAGVVLVMFLVCILEAGLWATLYFAVGAIEGFEASLYFSVVTFTTLGYGDVTLDDSWRLLASFAAADGILKFGWTTALIVFVVRRIHETILRR